MVASIWDGIASSLKLHTRFAVIVVAILILDAGVILTMIGITYFLDKVVVFYGADGGWFPLKGMMDISHSFYIIAYIIIALVHILSVHATKISSLSIKYELIDTIEIIQTLIVDAIFIFVILTLTTIVLGGAIRVLNIDTPYLAGALRFSAFLYVAVFIIIGLYHILKSFYLRINAKLNIAGAT